MLNAQVERERLDFPLAGGEVVHPPICSDSNDRSLRHSARSAALVVAAWGAHALEVSGGAARIARVLSLLRYYNDVYLIRRNSDGQPAHPLMLPATLRPELWWRKS